MSKKVYKVRIGEAAEALGVSPATVRRWETSGKITAERTLGGQRRYDLSALLPDKFSLDSPTRRTVAYARVSSHDQSADLERQKQVLELYCAKQGWTFGVVADLGSGMNYHKNKKLLDDITQAVADSQP